MNVVRMRVRLLEVVVDESLGGLGDGHRSLSSLNAIRDVDFWVYRVGGQRSRRWSLNDPAKAPARIDVVGPQGGATGASTSRPSVTSGQESVA